MTRLEATSAVLFLVLLAVYVTWPQALHPGDAVVNHIDPYFSTWRLAWFAHGVAVAPHHLFDANIFYPEPRTLAYSDATFLEGALAAPLIWAGVNPVAVYNGLLLAGIAGSGIGMLVLVQHLTSSSRAALVGAAVFTLLPYRVEHVMHLELQWAIWIPLTWWALHRTFERPGFRTAALTGVFIWLQLLSCVYYGVFLGLATAVLAILLAISADRTRVARAFAWLAAGASLVLPLAALYARPYVVNAGTLGERSVGEVARFSATPASYVTGPAASLLWGAWAGRFTGDELHLFPGIVAVALAGLAFASRRRRPTVAVYAALAAFAVTMSFGEHAAVYAWLRAHLFFLRGFRAAARFSIVAFAAMSVLAAIGYEWLESRSRRWSPAVVMVTCLVALGLDVLSAPAVLADVDTRTPDVYKMLRSLPAAPVVEFPVADPAALPGYDPVYMLSSIAHWRPLVNGYSGYVSEGYVSRLEQLQEFPDRRAMSCLERLGVRYVIVHETYYRAKELPALLLAIAQQGDLTPIGRYLDSVGRAQLFEIRGSASR